MRCLVSMRQGVLCRYDRFYFDYRATTGVDSRELELAERTAELTIVVSGWKSLWRELNRGREAQVEFQLENVGLGAFKEEVVKAIRRPPFNYDGPPSAYVRCVASIMQSKASIIGQYLLTILLRRSLPLRFSCQ